MELAALILINLFCLVLMYFLFSLRIAAAEKRLEDRSIGKQLKDNVQVALELIDLSLKEMDRKNATFYQLTERAEQLRKAMVQPEKRNRKKKAPAGLTPVEEETIPLPPAYEKLLAREDSVRLDLTVREERPLPERSLQRSPFLGLLEGTGQFVLKMFGVNKNLVLPETPSAPERAPQRADFASYLEERTAPRLDILSDDEFELPFARPRDPAQLSPAERRSLAQEMIEAGSAIARIVSSTGLSRAEVEFLQALPARKDRPRRIRRQTDDG